MAGGETRRRPPAPWYDRPWTSVNIKKGGLGRADDLFGDTPRRVRVPLPLPLAGAYDYVLPAGLDGRRGAIVEVPLGKRLINGVIWGDAAGDVADGPPKATSGIT